MFFNTNEKMNNFSFACQRQTSNHRRRQNDQMAIIKDKDRKTRSRLIIFAVALMAVNYALVAQYRDEGAKEAPILVKSEMTKDQVEHLNLAKP